MKKTLILASAMMVVGLLSGCGTPGTTDTTNPEMDAFAQCLTDAGVMMYGSPTCPYCNKQKEMFGESFAKINYVDCVEDPQACTDAEVEGIPAWDFEDGSRMQGLQELYIIGQKVGCEAPEEE